MTLLDKMLQAHKLSCAKRKGGDICTCGLDGAIVELAALRKENEQLREVLIECSEYLTEKHPERVKYPEYIEHHLWCAVNIAPGKIVPFCSPDPKPITRDEIMGGG